MIIQLGVVIIGRNEGERLKRCISSLLKVNAHIVYVDSASTDNSVAFVKKQGCDVVELDMSIPFSAARARNEGYRFLLERYPKIEFIQFVDGDCEVVDGWLSKALTHLQQHANVAAVCGRRRERFTEHSIYNRLCDIEWDTPIGFVRTTGGDFMCKVDPLVAVGGFNPTVVAGEEPELCFRLREKNWKIERLDAEMTLHDAAIVSWRQWWKRCERSGHAYAQVSYMHSNSHEKLFVKEVIRILFWGFVLPIMILLLSFGVSFSFLLIFFVYPLKVLQLTRFYIKRYPSLLSFLLSFFNIFEKFPQLIGVFKFFIKNFMGRKVEIIEYK